MIKFLKGMAVGLMILTSCASEVDKKAEQEQTTMATSKVVAWQMPDTASYAKYGKAKLSDYHFFEGRLSDLQPTERVFPYDINSPLFSDYALKKRFIYVPEDKKIVYNNDEVLAFPVGSVLIKNFYFDDSQLTDSNGKIIETRLLINEEKGWKALVYLWNEEQTDAYLEITGRKVPMQLASHGAISYSVPNMLQCKSCHDRNGEIAPIGPSVRQMNKQMPNGDNQMSKLMSMGWLKDAPPADQWPALAKWEDVSASVDDRARAYLEVNCGHCHSAGGPAKNSGLDLTSLTDEAHAMGIYKAPVAAGKGSGDLKYDIVPGKPEQSILIYRMESNDPAIMMPELGRSIVHKEGVELIKEWVKQLKEDKVRP